LATKKASHALALQMLSNAVILSAAKDLTPHHCITQASQSDHRFECEVPRSARNDPLGGLLPIFRVLVSWLNTDGTKGSREKNPATARGNPEA